ncbi:hypothetical protein LAZ67_18000103 [Cordylochernes scorpioides]|uniref:Uncharacterized protein n=1 Tax=Cordylochernes scorpioides TaxID=51811 RepID=A0ABY6LID1_9ARAC|nr:hypothetical protein LAZ67_18000103 [Cordylochernes scorpioides]
MVECKKGRSNITLLELCLSMEKLTLRETSTPVNQDLTAFSILYHPPTRLLITTMGSLSLVTGHPENYESIFSTSPLLCVDQGMLSAGRSRQTADSGNCCSLLRHSCPYYPCSTLGLSHRTHLFSSDVILPLKMYLILFFFLISTQSYQDIKLVKLVDGVCWGLVELING